MICSVLFFLAEALIVGRCLYVARVSHFSLHLLCDKHALALSICISSLVQAFRIGDLLFVLVVFFLAEVLVMFQ